MKSAQIHAGSTGVPAASATARGRQQADAATGTAPEAAWRGLYRAGGAAALLAGLLFRRNIAAEVWLFAPNSAPDTVEGWFALLQENPLLGLAYLNFFDVVDYTLLALLFLALYPALRRYGQSAMALAALCGILGAGIYCASNTALAMLSLSGQYAAAGGEVQKTALLSAGQVLLALTFTGGATPSTGVYMSFLLVALGGLLISSVMLRGGTFGKAAGYTGLLASLLDLTYCVTFATLPGLTVYLMSAAGLLLMIWHILVGWKLLSMKA